MLTTSRLATVLTLENSKHSKSSDSKPGSLQEEFNKAFVQAMNDVNATPRDEKGVWYYDEFHDYCQKEKKEFKKDFETGFADPEFWEKTAPYTFKIKKGKKPSEAILAFLKGFTIADCGNVLMACQAAALLKVLGEERFNLIFDSTLTITQKLSDYSSCIKYFFDPTVDAIAGKIGRMRGNRGFLTGETAHIRGLPFYGRKHPAGSGGGINVVCVGKNKQDEDIFIWFCPNMLKTPLTERAIGLHLVEQYNLDRTQFDFQVIHSDQSPDDFDLKKHGIKDIEPVASALNKVGFMPNTTMAANFSKIEKCLNSDIKNLKEVIAEMETEKKAMLLADLEDTKQVQSSHTVLRA
jgi:hypothetical protein